MLSKSALVSPFYREADIFAASIKEKILKWLVSEDFTARHSTIGEAHSANTGTWLLKQLQPWFAASGPRLIICKGVRIVRLEVWLILSRCREDIFDV